MSLHPLLFWGLQVLEKVLEHLLGRSLRAVACTCRVLRSLARSMRLKFIPGMSLPKLYNVDTARLLKHQVASVQVRHFYTSRLTAHPFQHTTPTPFLHPEAMSNAIIGLPTSVDRNPIVAPDTTSRRSHAPQWMLRREARLPLAGTDPDPRHVKVIDSDGEPVYIDRESMTVMETVPEPLHSGGGGCLSDAPGLGKTVTSIALMQWTLGRRSRLKPVASEARRRTELAELVWEHTVPCREEKVIEVAKKVEEVLKRAWGSAPNSGDMNLFIYPLFQLARGEVCVYNRDIPDAWYADDSQNGTTEFADLIGEVVSPDWFHEPFTVNDISCSWQHFVTIDTLRESIAGIFEGWIKLQDRVEAEGQLPLFFRNKPHLLPRLQAIAQCGRAVLKQLPGVMVELEEDVAGGSFGDRGPQKPLLTSGATLVIVPDHMVPHWANQIRECVVPPAGVSQKAKMARNADVTEETAETEDDPKCYGWWRTKTRDAFFDWEIGQPAKKKLPRTLPSPQELADKWVVVVSARRLAKQGLSVDCPLFRVNWLRLLVDEGDTIGAGENASNTNINLRLLTADHRWIISGTPTPIKFGDSGLGWLRNLLQFVKASGPTRI